MEAQIKVCHPCKDTEAARFQDREYGKGNRVHNPLHKKEGTGKTQFRCTVCGSVS